MQAAKQDTTNDGTHWLHLVVASWLQSWLRLVQPRFGSRAPDPLLTPFVVDFLNVEKLLAELFNNNIFRRHQGTHARTPAHTHTHTFFRFTPLKNSRRPPWSPDRRNRPRRHVAPHHTVPQDTTPHNITPHRTIAHHATHHQITPRHGHITTTQPSTPHRATPDHSAGRRSLSRQYSA